MSNKTTPPPAADNAAEPDNKGALAFCGMSMFNHIALSGCRVAMSLTALSLGMSTLMVGFLLALFSLLPMLLSVRVGRLVDRIGVRRPLRVGTVLVILGSLMPAVWLHPTVLLISACSIGIGFMLHQVAVQNMLGQASPQQRLRNFSWMALSMSISGFSGPLIAGLGIDNLGAQVTFGVLALGPLLALAGLYHYRVHLPVTRVQLVPPGTPKPRVSELFAQPELRRVLLANTLLSGAWDVHTFIVPIFGVSIGLSATTIGIILSAFALATFLIRTVLPLIQRRVRPWTLVCTAMIGAGSVFLLYPLFTDVRALIGLSFALGLFLGCSQPSVLALMHQHAPQGRIAEVVGLRMALVSSTQVILPLSFGALGSAVGLAPLFWGYALSLLLGGWVNREKRPTRKPRVPSPVEEKAAAERPVHAASAQTAAAQHNPAAPAPAPAPESAPARSTGTAAGTNTAATSGTAAPDASMVTDAVRRPATAVPRSQQSANTEFPQPTAPQPASPTAGEPSPPPAPSRAGRDNR